MVLRNITLPQVDKTATASATTGYVHLVENKTATASATTGYVHLVENYGH